MSISRRDFLKLGSSLSVAAGMALATGSLTAREDRPPLPPPPLKPEGKKPRYRFSLDPREAQKEGLVVYNYGTHENSTPSAGLDGWYGLKGHNFAGCRSYPVADKKTISREDVRKHWESRNVVPVFMTGADPKSGAEAVRKSWDEAVRLNYPVLSIDEFYPAPRTPVEYNRELEKFRKEHPEIYIQVWEASFAKGVAPDAFPQLEALTPFVDAYMPEVYWKWFKDDGERRKLLKNLIDRSRKMGAVDKLVIGLGTHDVPHIKKTMEDIPAILDMEPEIGGLAFFVHMPGASEEYDKLYAQLDEQLRGLFA
ncbi:MAG: hypothetical protein A2Z34_09200 [Planctomycetes bacterium RBG_16_59_8]|nr:MAG: hypothetical protein A2Z34_09200 [Planctomycetes bacterium RBG_16_59_8]